LGEIYGTHDVFCRKFAADSRKNAPFLPLLLFLTHDALSKIISRSSRCASYLLALAKNFFCHTCMNADRTVIAIDGLRLSQNER